MARVALIGGGIAGLTAAYELEQQRRAGRPVDWHLFEAGAGFGGIVSTTRIATPDGEFILEDGPDGWVTDKPWARELADELGLGAEVIACNEADKKTYIWLDGQLVAMPGRMRLMVPEDLDTLRGSPLFSPSAQGAYAAELTRADELRAAASPQDESVASFVRRHFGDEVLARVAAPLLSGVFGGDVERLSVRAVMPAFVLMEASHGSLIAALQAKAAQRAGRPPQPTFMSLRRGMGSLAEALVAALPADRLHSRTSAAMLRRSPAGGWLVRFGGADAHACAIGFVPYDEVVLATPAGVTRQLLAPVDPEAASWIPVEASSAVLVTFCWPASTSSALKIPPGFGFLVPAAQSAAPQLLAATFVDQKYAYRAPDGCRIVRAFFGGGSAARLAGATNDAVAKAAFAELQSILGPLPEPAPELTTVRRWPQSLPQYEVGHLERMAALGERVKALGRLHLLGNGYHGVGVPDLIRDARATARKLAESLI